jgi:hypothetical protein
VTGCYDCGRPYGDEHGFPDLIVPLEVWNRISPTGNSGGLLCPSCICKRLYDAGIRRVEAAFMSGPIISVSPQMMQVMRQVENIEEHLVGRAGLTAKIASARDRDATLAETNEDSAPAVGSQPGPKASPSPYPKGHPHDPQR